MRGLIEEKMKTIYEDSSAYWREIEGGKALLRSGKNVTLYLEKQKDGDYILIADGSRSLGLWGLKKGPRYIKGGIEVMKNLADKWFKVFNVKGDDVRTSDGWARYKGRL